MTSLAAAGRRAASTIRHPRAVRSPATGRKLPARARRACHHRSARSLRRPCAMGPRRNATRAGVPLGREGQGTSFGFGSVSVYGSGPTTRIALGVTRARGATGTASRSWLLLYPLEAGIFASGMEVCIDSEKGSGSRQHLPREVAKSEIGLRQDQSQRGPAVGDEVGSENRFFPLSNVAISPAS